MKRAVLLVVGADMYGLSRVALQIVERLSDDMVVEVWASQEGPLIDEVRRRGGQARVVPLPVLRRPEVMSARLPLTVVRLLWQAMRLWLLARRERAHLDLVHALGAPSLGGVVVARAAGCRLLWSVHEVFGSGPETRLFGRLLRQADIRVACSEYVASQFSPGSFRVIHSGTDVSVGARKLGSTGCTTVICVGRLNRWKGQDALLRAFARLPNELRQASRLLLVGGPFAGDPSVADELLSLTRALRLENEVQMLGERADAQALMGQADLVVVPSQKPEPFGMVVIEGMALGRAVIATTPGGPAEVITDGQDGILVPVGDEDALSRALERLLSNVDEARQLGERARVTAQRFSGGAAAEQYRQVYLEVLA